MPFLPLQRKNKGVEFCNISLTFWIVEFNDLWHSLRVPNEVDLPKQLESEGLQVTNAQTLAPKASSSKKKGKRGGAPRQRQVRITNTHMKGEIDLSKDYVAPGKS